MKKLFTARHLSLLLLLSLFGGSKAQAAGSYEDDRCFGREYECSCNPLNCGSFGLQVQAGVYPILWTRRGDISLINCVPTTSPVLSAGELPRFSKLFRVPWDVGGKVSYAMSDNTDIFVEFNYVQARSKDCASLSNCGSNSCGDVVVAPAIPLLLSLNKYKLFNAYFGARYYFDRWCDRVSLFVGEKVGLVHRKRSGFSSLTGNCNVDCNTDCVTSCNTSNNCGNDFFGNTTVVSGGVHAGLDVCFCGNWAFVVTAEVVASCGPRSNGNLVLSADDALLLGGSNLLVGSVGTELSFPVTVGIKYNF